ncbi:uncharacterized protein LOC117181213 [Belonocnema kinseyi]|uniref:uncharacterized protein LOC117181213 n=1 Tax=Belonocnema kinseyi TaxID=2817044 RepID=UPI00143DDF80|nr:uncharacterized protein LOC117181213 [Belonocnema kinseyi]
MEHLSVQEKIDMILSYGENGKNVEHAVTLYVQRFPDSVRSLASFYQVLSKFTTNGSVQAKKRNSPKTFTGVNNEIAVLATVANDPHVSIRHLSRDSGTSQSSVLRVLKRNKYHLFHLSQHDELQGNDFQNRMTFYQWALQQM